MMLSLVLGTVERQVRRVKPLVRREVLLSRRVMIVPTSATYGGRRLVFCNLLTNRVRAAAQ